MTKSPYIAPKATVLKLDAHGILNNSPGQHDISIGNQYNANGATDCYSNEMNRAWDDTLDWKL